MSQDQHGRVFKRVAMEVQVDLRSENTFFTGFSENISEGGLFVATEMQYRNGDILEVSLGLMGKAPRPFRGVVRWSRPGVARGGLPAGVGLQFVDLNEEDRQYLQDFVDSRLKDTLFYDLD